MFPLRFRLVLPLFVALGLCQAAAAQDTTLARAFELERRGEYANAVAVYRSILTRKPGDLSALLGLERVLLPLNRSTEILPDANGALAANPTSARAVRRRASRLGSGRPTRQHARRGGAVGEDRAGRRGALPRVGRRGAGRATPRRRLRGVPAGPPASGTGRPARRRDGAAGDRRRRLHHRGARVAPRDPPPPRLPGDRGRDAGTRARRQTSGDPRHRLPRHRVRGAAAGVRAASQVGRPARRDGGAGEGPAGCTPPGRRRPARAGGAAPNAAKPRGAAGTGPRAGGARLPAQPRPSRAHPAGGGAGASPPRATAKAPAGCCRRWNTSNRDHCKTGPGPRARC